MDGWADGWMGGWESGWMDGRMYGCERRMDSGGGSRRHAGRVFVVLVEGVVVIVKSKGGMGVSRCREKIEEEKKKDLPCDKITPYAVLHSAGTTY